MKRFLVVVCVLILGVLCVAYAGGKAGGPPAPPEGKSTMKMPREEVKAKMRGHEGEESEKPEMGQRYGEMMKHHPMPMYMHGREWESMAGNLIERIMREAHRLGLREEQVAQLRQTMEELKKRTIMTHARVETLMIDLKAVVENGGPFEKMRDIVNQIVDAKRELAMAQIDALQRARNIVGEEAWQKIFRSKSKTFKSFEKKGQGRSPMERMMEKGR